MIESAIPSRSDRLSPLARTRNPRVSRFVHWGFASPHGEPLLIRGPELCAHLLIFEEEERKYPLTICFAGRHKHTHGTTVIRFGRNVCPVLLPLGLITATLADGSRQLTISETAIRPEPRDRPVFFRI